MSLRTYIDRGLITLFDARCVACTGQLLAGRIGPVCASCWATIAVPSAPLCATCGDPLPNAGALVSQTCDGCVTSPPVYDAARAAGLYTGSLRSIVHALKYGRHPLIAPELGRRMRVAAGDWLNDACVVPVPLHPWRSWQRGFNQAELLARELGAPIRHLVWRSVLGRPQAGLAADQRHANVQGAYRRRWSWGTVPGRVVLVDDVLTTGATAGACAQVLKSIGVGDVRVLTAARAARHHRSFGSTANSTAERTSSLATSPSISTQPGRTEA